MDMMLHLISREHGRELSAAISEMFVYERIRNEQDHQRVPLKHMLGTNQPKLQEIVALMEANLEELIDLDELAKYVNISRRQLERLFQKNLNCTPLVIICGCVLSGRVNYSSKRTCRSSRWLPWWALSPRRTFPSATGNTSERHRKRKSYLQYFAKAAAG